MAKKQSGLGRGLDALFLDNAIESRTGNGEHTITNIKVSIIDPKSDQPRKAFDKEALEQLSQSIKENGLLQPILVRERKEGRYQIIAGERRFRASKLAGLTEIPCIILDKDDKSTAEIALIENIQREDLNPVEEASAYRSLADDFHMTQEEIAQKVGKSRSAIANATRLLDLPGELLTKVADGTLSAGHARTLLGLKYPDDMFILARKVTDNGLTVRQLEEEVKRANKAKKKIGQPTDTEEEDESAAPKIDYFRELELKMQSELGRQVRIHGKGRKKFITLFYEDNEDLDDIIAGLCGKDFLDNL